MRAVRFPRPHFFAFIVAAVLGLGMGEGEAATQGQKAAVFSGKIVYPNLLANPNNFTLWSAATATVTPGITDPLGGTTASTITASSSFSSVYEYFTTSSSLNYVNSWWVRRRTGTGQVQMRDPGQVLHTIALSSSWQQFSFTSNGAGGATIFQLSIAVSSDAVDIYMASAKRE